MIISIVIEPNDGTVDEAPFEVLNLDDAAAIAQTWALVMAIHFQQNSEWQVLDHSEDVDPDCARGTCRAPIVRAGPQTYLT